MSSSSSASAAAQADDEPDRAEIDQAAFFDAALRLEDVDCSPREQVCILRNISM